MVGPPSGTVTFLLTDISGSTRLLASAGDDYPRLVVEQRDIIGAAVERAGGVAKPFEGDGCLAVFDDPAAAVTAAVEAQQDLAAHLWSTPSPVRVRIGLHTGTAIVRDGEHFGLALHKAARIADAGHGGQVLLSAATRRQLTWLPDEISLVDLGAHRLKDLEAPLQLFQVVAQRAATRFPPLRTLRDTRHNLPEQTSSLLGRDDDVAAVSSMLRAHRLVTVTGTGGVGKTRLAMHVGARASDAFSDGVWLVELARTRDPTAVPALIAEQLGVDPTGSDRIGPMIADLLHDRTVLLILDNFEHVVGAAPVVKTILAGAPRVRVVTTSREPLLIAGEQTYPLAPLATPTGHDGPALAASAPVALFIERARAHDPDFAPTPGQVADIAQICELVDGLPLAIELAAAQTRVLAVGGVLDRLGRGLDALSGRTRDRPARHQTLRATLAWSNDLLAPDERRLLRRLAVFEGGRTLAAVEAVCADPDIDVVDSLTALVDKSLVQRRIGPDGDVRFVLLEVIHQFARELLDASADAEDVRRRHARWFADLAVAADDGLVAEDAVRWEDTINEQLGNIRAALSWSFGDGDVAVGIRITAALFMFWHWGGVHADARHWIARASARPELLDHGTRARLGAALGYLEGDRDLDAARDHWDGALADFRACGDVIRTTYAYSMLALTDIGDAERYGDARRLADEAVANARQIVGNRRALTDALTVKGELARTVGDYDVAAACYEEALALSRPAGDDRYVATILTNMASVAGHRGDPARALRLTTEALGVFAKSTRRDYVAVALGEVATHEHRAGRSERAATLLGAVDATMGRMGVSRQPADRIEYERVCAELATELGADRVAELGRRGAELSLDDAVDLVLRGPTPPTS